MRQNRKNDMEKFTTDPVRTGQKIGKPNGLDTLGGEFGLCWNGTVPLTAGAHRARAHPSPA